MKLAEILEKAGIDADEKARRITNVSARLANVTADEIEDGITIERLENIGVPVFKYATQLTIHGRLPEFSEGARPGGYKSIVRNENGSLGVRYVAIDGAKKQRIREAMLYCEKPLWRATINSKGLEISAYFAEKDDCLAAFRSFPRALFAGSVIAAAGFFGGYYVIAYLGAIYEADLWPLIGELWGIESEAALADLIAAREAQRESERAAMAIQIAQRNADADARKREQAASIGLPLLRELPRGEGAFVRICERGPVLYVLKRRGPALCYAARDYKPGLRTFEPSGKMRRFDAVKRGCVEKALAAGLVFQV